MVVGTLGVVAVVKGVIWLLDSVIWLRQPRRMEKGKKREQSNREYSSKYSQARSYTTYAWVYV